MATSVESVCKLVSSLAHKLYKHCKPSAAMKALANLPYSHMVLTILSGKPCTHELSPEMAFQSATDKHNMYLGLVFNNHIITLFQNNKDQQKVLN